MSMSQVKVKVELPLKSSEAEVHKTEVERQPSTDRVIGLTFQKKREIEATNDERDLANEPREPITSCDLSEGELDMRI